MNCNIKDIITNYDNPSGALELRQQIAKRSLDISQKITIDKIIVTNGCMESVNICLRAVAKPGDTIIVESPTFFCFLQLIEDLNMLALEIPTDPEHGIDIESLKQALEKNDVKACIFNSNFQNPLGYAMSSNKKRELVDLLGKRNIPIIEDDIYGDLYFGKTRPSTLKSLSNKRDRVWMAPNLLTGYPNTLTCQTEIHYEYEYVPPILNTFPGLPKTNL